MGFLLKAAAGFVFRIIARKHPRAARVERKIRRQSDYSGPRRTARPAIDPKTPFTTFEDIFISLLLHSLPAQT
jgi:hypothetical protein